MVTVRVVDPADAVSISLPEPAKDNARRFHPSTRKEFLRQLSLWATEEGRPLFIASEENHLVAIGLIETHQILKKSERGVLLSDSHAIHRTSEDLKVGDWYNLAINPASNEILEAIRVDPQPVVTPPQGSLFLADRKKLQKVTQSDADTFFSRVQRQPHIPFQYPANYCMARAHEMCRLIERHFDPNPKDVVIKIWNFGDLEVKTENNPGCIVNWGYHVAPVVKIGGEDDLLVLDPALFGKPVEVDEWLSLQSDAKSKFFFTTLDAYDQVAKGLFVREAQDQTAEQLRRAWRGLISQIYQDGPLPYQCGAA